MATYGKALDAMGDPMRRTILERLAAGPSAVGRLAHGLPVSRPAVSQHLKVLREAGLVVDRQEGTSRIYSIDPAGIATVRDYWEGFWSGALERYQAAARRRSQRDRRPGRQAAGNGGRRDDRIR